MTRDGVIPPPLKQSVTGDGLRAKTDLAIKVFLWDWQSLTSPFIDYYIIIYAALVSECVQSPLLAGLIPSLYPWVYCLSDY